MNEHFSIVLGTAQLGMRYGVANKDGKPDQLVADEIVRTAWELGVRQFDTAQGYGESELVLGNVLMNLGISSQAKLISKLDPKIDHLSERDLELSVDSSLGKLHVSRLFGLMLHREDKLELWDQGLGKILLGLAKRGMVEHLGISVYSVEMAFRALDNDDIRMIQVPSNILDRRFLDSGFFDEAKRRDKFIYVRSVFLQGLLLMGLNDIPSTMYFARPVIEKLSKLAIELDISPLDLALGFAKKCLKGSFIVIGAEKPEQIEDDMRSWKKEIPSQVFERLKNEFSDIDNKIINPAMW